VSNQHTAGWTDERVEALRKLWADGKSAAQVALAIGGGATRSAVIGKVHRIGIANRSFAAVPENAPPPRRSAFALAEFDPVIARVVASWTSEISKTNASNEQVESKDD
jgi:hypothetical protein